MRPVGFSTGALAYADFRRGLAMMQSQTVQAVELSALRQPELIPLLEAFDTLDLSGFTHISIHAPSQFSNGGEQIAVERLRDHLHRQWPIVVHPDALTDWGAWREFGPLLCIENMDRAQAYRADRARIGPRVS